MAHTWNPCTSDIFAYLCPTIGQLTCFSQQLMELQRITDRLVINSFKMAFAKIERDQVLDRLFEVFRAKGYDGASMADLAAATGLKKASLYHRFPEGKSSMADAVLDSIVSWTETNLVQVINSKKSPSERLDEVLRLINELYHGGEVDCTLRALSHGSASTLFQEKIGRIFKTWISAFADLAIDFGHDKAAAVQLGATTLSQIQGTLILSVTLGDKSLFDKALAEIRSRLLVN